MGTLIAPKRDDLFIEELDFRSGVSERSLFKLAAGINFINQKQAMPFIFEFAGPFRPLLGGEGGVLPLPNDQEIFAIGGRLRETGLTGSTVFDLHFERAGVDMGTVFSTKLTIPNTVAGPAYFWKNLIDTNSDERAGITQPVFSTTDFDQGDILRGDLDSNAGSAADLIIVVWTRPR